jgi:hypothetical protein
MASTCGRWLALLAPVMLLNGCESMSNTDKGVLAGGALGAGTGAIIGSATRHTGAGAVIGTAVGAVAGGLTGHAIDESEKKQQAALAAAQTAHGPVSIGDVIQLTHQHVGDDIIINQIRTTGTVFNLTVDDITVLKQNGVSDPVVREMQATAYRYPRRVYREVPAVQPVIVEQAPPPPVVGVGISGHFR